MKVLLDEDVPVPLIKLVRHILKGHTVHHVYFPTRQLHASATEQSVRANFIYSSPDCLAGAGWAW